MSAIPYSTLTAVLASRRFLVWKLVPQPDGKAPKKVPHYSDGTFRAAGATLDTPEDVGRLVSYSEAAAAAQRLGRDFAIGFALGADGNGGCWQGIDFDKLDAHPELVERLATLPGYVERSPSGNGVHAIGYGVPFPALASNASGVEGYSGGRYFTFTLNQMRDAPLTDLAPYVAGELVPLHSPGRPPVNAPSLPPAEWTTEHVDGWANPVKDLYAAALSETTAPKYKQAFGDDRTTSWLAQADPDELAAVGERSQARMSLIDRLMFLAGGNCAQVREAALQIPLCIKDEREQLLDDEILKARALFLAWWIPEKQRRDAQLAEAKAIGESIEESVLPVVLTVDEMQQRLVFIEKRRLVGDRVTRRVRQWDEAAAALAASRHKYIDPDNNKKHNVAALPAWRAHSARVSVDTVTWRPDSPVVCQAVEATGGNTRAFNTWNGLRPLVVPANWQEWVVAFTQHVAFLVPDPGQRGRFLQWLAHIVQCPGVLPHTCYLFVARETGVGRNWLASLLARVMPGNVAVGIALSEVLDGGFNGRLQEKLLAVVDEVREGATGDRYQRGEALKRLLTVEHRRINEKYGPDSVSLNVCRWLMFSNHDDALPFDANDRRVIVVENPAVRASPEYYTQIYSLLQRPEFAGAVREYLRTLDISAFNPGEIAPMSAAKARSLASMASGIDKAVRVFKDTWPAVVATRSDLRQFIVDETGDPPNEMALSKALDRVGIAESAKVRLRFESLGRRERLLGLHGISGEHIDAADPEKLKQIIRDARSRFAAANPTDPTVPTLQEALKVLLSSSVSVGDPGSAGTPGFDTDGGTP